jgi:hypothetical protein
VGDRQSWVVSENPENVLSGMCKEFGSEMKPERREGG